ncbi:MAG: hypothetical protein ACRER5_16220 [Pseudomonas sp.]
MQKRSPVRVSTTVTVPADASRLEAALRLRMARAILWGRDKERGLAVRDPEAAKAYATRLERAPLAEPHAPDILEQRLREEVAAREMRVVHVLPPGARTDDAGLTQGSLF